MSEDYVLEEVLADYYAGIDVYAGTENAQADIEARGRNVQKTVGSRGEAASEEDGGETRFSLNEFEDGRRFVDVQTDQDLFNNLSDTEKLALARTVIKQRFAGKVIGIDNRAFVNGRTGEEYSRLKKPLPDASTGIMDAKARVSTELDNLLDAGFNFRTAEDGQDGHLHPNLTGPYNYFDAIFKIGNEYFQGVINLENNRLGRRFKDVTKIKNITKDTAGSYGNNPKTRFLRDASMSKIAQNGEEVKTSRESDTPYNCRCYDDV